MKLKELEILIGVCEVMIEVVLKLNVYVVCFIQMEELIVNRIFQNY